MSSSSKILVLSSGVYQDLPNYFRIAFDHLVETGRAIIEDPLEKTDGKGEF
jgi:hypothetical protein